jgi:hypothetical protein
MIQRKQTLFLLLSIVLMVGYIFAPIIRIDGGPNLHSFVKAHELAVNVNFPVIGHYFVFVCLVAASIAITLQALTIVLFKYRKLQIFLCWISVIPTLYCFCYAYYRMTSSEMIQDQLFFYGNILPIVSLFLIFLAMYSIRKDEELVKSVDRLR